MSSWALSSLAFKQGIQKDFFCSLFMLLGKQGLCKPTLSLMVVYHDAVPLVSPSPLPHGFLVRSTENAQECWEMTENFCSVWVVVGAGRDPCMGRGRVAVPWHGSKRAAFKGSIKCARGNQKVWKQGQHGDVTMALLLEVGRGPRVVS